MERNEIQVFDNTAFGSIRVVDVGNDPWFVAMDVCNALGIQTRDVRKVLDEDEVSTVNVDTIHIGQNGGKAPLVISEAGLYSLMLDRDEKSTHTVRTHGDDQNMTTLSESGQYSSFFEPSSIVRIIYGDMWRAIAPILVHIHSLLSNVSGVNSYHQIHVHNAFAHKLCGFNAAGVCV